jgi:hypothetical protein
VPLEEFAYDSDIFASEGMVDAHSPCCTWPYAYRGLGTCVRCDEPTMIEKPLDLGILSVDGILQHDWLLACGNLEGMKNCGSLACAINTTNARTGCAVWRFEEVRVRSMSK